MLLFHDIDTAFTVFYVGKNPTRYPPRVPSTEHETYSYYQWRHKGVGELPLDYNT